MTWYYIKYFKLVEKTICYMTEAIHRTAIGDGVGMMHLKAYDSHFVNAMIVFTAYGYRNHGLHTNDALLLF